MTVWCTHCQAFHWKAERLSSSTAAVDKFGSCCRQGKIKIDLPKRPPATLWDLFTRVHPLSQNFFENIRQFNAALAFTSLGTGKPISNEQPPGGGPYIFKIGGEVYHQSADLVPIPNGPNPPCYAQLYVYDKLEDAADQRSAHPSNSKCDRGLMRELTGVLHASHHYATLYKHAWQRMNENGPGGVQNVSMVIRQNRNDDRRRYNRPTSDEIAVIIPDQAVDMQRNIVLFKQGGGFKRIDAWNPAYACLHYVLLFPHGEHGFQQEDDGPAGRKTVSQLEYYAYTLFLQEKFTGDDPIPPADVHFSTIHRGGRLFQQYVADIWANIDQSCLLYFDTHQDTIRSELYNGLRDALLGDDLACGDQVGRRILPSSYYGGTRQMMESYQDAMAIARFMGGPQLFITMTANP
ncbi:hypothetical protein BDV93DRAFT_415339, partial [Ceratobasidium sp. AG-I]